MFFNIQLQNSPLSYSGDSDNKEKGWFYEAAYCRRLLL